MRDFKSPQWWTQLVAQLITLAALAGVLTADQAKGIEDSAAKAIAAAAIVLANVWLIRGIVIGSRTPPEDDPPPPTLPMRPALVALLICGVGASIAQERSQFIPAQTVEQIKASCWGNDNRLKALERRPVDAEVLAELRALRTEQARLLALLENLQRGPVPGPLAAPAPQPGPIIIIPPGGTPRYELPPGGTPRYDLPGGGTPRYELPPGGTPRYDLPGGGTPKYDLPGGAGNGGSLRMELPPGGALRMELPGGTAPAPGTDKPAPARPGDVKPGPIVPGELRTDAAPGGYIRYTLWRNEK